MKRNWTKVLSLLACLMMIMAFSVPVLANDGAGGTDGNITWSLDNNDNLHIELASGDAGEMPDYTSFSKTPWYNVSSSIVSVTIGKGVNSIGAHAFEHLTALTEVKFNGSISKISDNAFKNCTSLKAIDLSSESKLESIGNNAFEGCTSLADVKLSPSLKSMGDYAFSKCTSLAELNLNSSLEMIGTYAFQNCSNLETLGNLNETKVVTIEEGTFYNCTKLKNIKIGNNTTNIVDFAFNGCSSIEEITIPQSVTSIGKFAFQNMESLKKFIYEGTEVLMDADGVFGNNADGFVIASSPDSSIRTYATENNFTWECINHDWNTEYTVDKAKTCTEDGQESIHCKVCNAIKEDSVTVIPASHEYVEKKITEEPTCTDYGIKIVECTVCGDETTERIPALGHKYESVVVKAGYLKNGSSYKQCTVCGAKANVKTLAGYSSYVTKSFKVSKGKKSFTAKWSKASKANQKKMSGYQIRYSTKSSMSGAKYAKASKTSKSKTIKKLSKNKKYYVQVRNYMKKGGKTYYSKWSSKKTVKTK